MCCIIGDAGIFLKNLIAFSGIPLKDRQNYDILSLTLTGVETPYPLFTELIVYPLYDTWDHYSGNPLAPVKPDTTGGFPPCDRWEGIDIEGLLRQNLLAHMINSLTLNLNKACDV